MDTASDLDLADLIARLDDTKATRTHGRLLLFCAILLERLAIELSRDVCLVLDCKVVLVAVLDGYDRTFVPCRVLDHLVAVRTDSITLPTLAELLCGLTNLIRIYFHLWLAIGADVNASAVVGLAGDVLTIGYILTFRHIHAVDCAEQLACFWEDRETFAKVRHCHLVDFRFSRHALNRPRVLTGGSCVLLYPYPLDIRQYVLGDHTGI